MEHQEPPEQPKVKPKGKRKSAPKPVPEKVSIDEYKKNQRREVRRILGNYLTEKFIEKASDSSDNEESPKKSEIDSPVVSRHSSRSRNSNNSQLSDRSNPAKRHKTIDDIDDEMLAQTPEERLEHEILKKDRELDTLRAEVHKLQKLHEPDMTEEVMLEETCADYQPKIEELITKNLLGSEKIETLFSKVRRSREKIDQVLNDLNLYQKEYETILINKKCRPLKNKISCKILEARLE